MSGLPTPTVLLDDGTATFPYDITTYARLADGVKVARGRGDEFAKVQPSTLDLVLDNIDGRFTLGSTSGGYGAINVDRQIQYKETVGGVTTTRFTGYVQNWPTSWPDGGDQFAVAAITAVDRMPRLSRRKLRSIIEQEYLLDAPLAYYTCGEATGSSRAYDSSGNSQPPLVRALPNADIVFGTATGPGTDDLTAVVIDDVAANGNMLTAQITGAVVGASVFFSTTYAGINLLLTTDDGSTVNQIYIDGTGKLTTGLGGTTSASVVNDGDTHHAAWTASGVHLDGIVFDATPFPSQTSPAIRLGRASLLSTGATPGPTTFAHLALFSTSPTTAHILREYRSGNTGFINDRSDQRISRYAEYGSIAVADQALETGLQTAVPLLTLAGISVADAIGKVEDSEGGVVFVRGDGKFVLQNRQHRALQTAADITLTAIDLGEGASVSTDMQFVTNYMAVTSGTGGVQVVQNAASIATHEQYPVDLELLVNTDDEALDVANWRVTNYAEPAARLPDVTVDLLTQTQATQQALMALEISDRMTITGMPSQAVNGTTTLNLIVEGWTETLTASSWDMAFNTSNFAQSAAWILDDTALSVLGSTTRLGY
jgi:hypothetical protein